MKCFNCEYYVWMTEPNTYNITCACKKKKKSICSFAFTPDAYINDYNIKGVNAPDWCPHYNTPDHEDGENGWETLRETNMMEWNP